jgi:hypothetical protein
MGHVIWLSGSAKFESCPCPFAEGVLAGKVAASCPKRLGSAPGQAYIDHVNLRQVEHP